MTRTKKALIAFLAVLCIVCTGLFTFTACSAKKTLVGIKADESAMKTVYVNGESLDLTGLVVTADYDVKGTVKTETLEASDYTTDPENGSVLSMGDGSTAFETTKNVTVSYSYGKDSNGDPVTETARVKVTVTKKVTAVRIDSQPDKTEYYVGEKFDPTGLKITATFQDNTSAQIDITAENATWTPNAEIPRGTTKVTVSYGGYDFDVDIEMFNAVYIQAIDGLYNGRPVAEVDADILAADPEDETKTRYDASLANAQSGAEALYRAHLNATDVAEEDVEDMVAAFKAGTNEDIEDWNYEELVARFCTTNKDGKYLGEIKVGDAVSFVFSSSEATKGNIAFRLASGYAKEIDKDAGWQPTVMGDIDFSTLCDMYVNGVKKEIEADTVILDGGETEDGSACTQLWMFWSLVTFEDFDFVAGRNVIELVFKDCGLQTAYGGAPTCNIDSLIINPADESTAEIDLYDNTKAGEELNTHLTVSAISLDEDELTLTVTGQITGGGYYVDIFTVNVGNTQAEVDFTELGTSYTAVVGLEGFDFGEMAVQINGVTVQKGSLTLPAKITLDDDVKTTYEVVEKDGEIYLVKDASKTYTLDERSLTKGTELSLEADAGNSKVYYIIEGNTFDFTYKGYEGAELDDLAEILAAKINALISFDLQECPPAGHSGTSWLRHVNDASNRQVIVDVEHKTYTLKVDITDVGDGPYTNHYEFTYNTAYKADGSEEDGWNDFKPADVTKPNGDPVGGDCVVAEVTLGEKKYQIYYHEGVNDSEGTEFWGNVGIVVSDAS